MAETNSLIGGITVNNSGEIMDSYVIWKNSPADNDRTLVTKNTGRVLTSALVRRGECEILFDQNGEYHKDVVIRKTTDIKNYGFDTSQCWVYAGNSAVLKYMPENWHYTNTDNEKRSVIRIKSTEQYVAFAEKVNSGDANSAHAKVLLECDLNFKGKRIPVIGRKREHAFTGVFDGQNHLIWNGIIRDEAAANVALFGYSKGIICNLTFDGRITGTSNIGGLCVYNMGKIECCGAVMRMVVRDDRCNLAGIAVYNEGTINRSYAVIESRRVVLPVVMAIVIALIVCMVGGVGYSTVVAAVNSGKEYATIEVDPNQHRSDKPDTEVEKNGSNSVEFTFNQKVVISKSEGICTLNFVNPSSDENKIVLELQIVNASGERVTIAQSKAILPGYQIESLTFNDDARDKMTGLETEGYVVLIPYNVKSDEKSMVHTELPIIIEYEE